MKIEIFINDEKQDDLVPYYIPDETVYIVFKKFSKTYIKKTKIKHITFTNMWSYYTEYHGRPYHDGSSSIFKSKEDASEYALERAQRLHYKIKYKGYYD